MGGGDKNMSYELSTDVRVVEMEFDNANFEKNIGETMKSLGKFENLLNTLVTAGSSNFFGALGNSLGNTLNTNIMHSLGSVSSGVQDVKIQFDALGIIGKRVLEDLTDTALRFASTGLTTIFNKIKEGGLRRAMNIEDAKFRLQGLSIAWDKISGDIDYGVDKTAYGLDQAAKAASVLAASGVEFGGVYKEGTKQVSDMGQALRAISGVAAMGNVEYERAAQIFETVAANGKLMTMQLRQFSAFGLSGSASLVKFFNDVNSGATEASEEVTKSIKDLTGGLAITEEALNEFVSKGKISFKVFSEAMDSAFGEHAADANKTLTGTLSNINAALSRIGALFFTPIILQEGPLVKMLNTVREKINDIKKIVEPFASVITERINEIILAVNYFISKLDFSKVIDLSVIKNIIDRTIVVAIKVFSQLAKIVMVVKKAFTDVFPYDFVNVGKAIVVILYEMISAFKISESTYNNIYTISYALFHLLKIGIKTLVTLSAVLAPVVEYILNFARVIGVAIISIAKWISGLKAVENKVEETSESFFVFEKVGNMLKKVQEYFQTFFNKIFHAADSDTLGDPAKQAIGPYEALVLVLGKVVGIYGKLKNVVKPVTDDIFKLLNTKFSTGVGSGIVGAITSIVAAILLLNPAIDKVKKFSTIFFDSKTGLLGKIVGNNMVNNLNHVLNSFTKSVNTFTKGLELENLKKIATSIAILAGSLLVLSFIPANKIAGSLFMMGAAFTALYLEFAGLAKIADSLDASKMLRLVPIIVAMAAAMAVMSGSIVLLTGALMVLSVPKVTDLILPLIAVFGMMAALWAAVGTLTKAADDYYSPNTFANLIAMTAMIGVLGIAVSSLMATAALISLVPWNKLLVGFGVMALTMVSLMGVVQYLIEIPRIADVGTVISAILLMGAISHTIKSISKSMIFIAILPWQRVAIGFLGLIGTLAAVGLVVEALGKLENSATTLDSVKMMVKIAASMWVFAKAMKSFEKINVIGVLPGLLLFAGVLTIFAVAAQPLAAAMGTLSEAIPIIAGIGAVLALYAVVFAGFAASAELFALSGYKVVETFILLGTIGKEQLNAIIQNVVTFTGALEYIGIALIVTIANIVTQMKEQLIAIGTTLLEVVVGLGPSIQTAVTVLFSAIAVGIINSVPTIAVALGTVFVLLGNLLASNMDLLSGTTVKLLQAYLATVRQYFPVISNEIVNTILALIQSISDTMVSAYPALGAILWNHIFKMLKNFTTIPLIIFGAFSNTFLGIIPRIFMLGVNIMKGLLNGILSAAEIVIAAVTKIANAIISVFTFILQIHSPSEVFHKFGIYLGEGLEKGIDDIYDRVTGKAKELGEGVKDSTEEGINGIDFGDINSKFSSLFGGIITGAGNATDALDLLFARFGAFNTSVSNVDKMVSKFSKDSKYSKGGGYQALEAQKKGTLNSYRNSKANGFGNIFDEFTKGAEDATKSLGDFGGAAGKAGGAAGGAAKGVDSLTESFKSMEEMQSSLQKKISGSIDIFSEFSRESDLSADKLLANMRSQVEGVRDWSNNLQKLGARGIEKGLLQKLAELGPQGWDKVQAFVQMTDDQLKEANSLFAQSLMLPESESSKIVSSFAQNGMWAAQGLINGIPVNAIYDVGMTMGTALDDGTKAALGIHSPSQVMFDNAVNIGQGVINGITYMIGKIQPLGAQMGRAILTGFNSSMGKATMFNVGKSVVDSFSRSFTKTKVINEAINTFCNNIKMVMEKGLLSVEYIEIAHGMMNNIILGYQEGMTEFLAEIDVQNKILSDKMLEAFTEVGTFVGEGLEKGIHDKIEDVANETIKLCNEVVKKARTTFDENSPSKVFMEIGNFVALGLAKGISSGSSKAVDATSTMANSTIKNFESALDRVRDYIQNGVNDDLTITPVMDLSNVNAGLKSMNSMFGSRRINLSSTLDSASRIASSFNKSGSGINSPNNSTIQNNYTFNQTNTSPKALSNAEIYRQTNNLINRYRSDIGA